MPHAIFNLKFTIKVIKRFFCYSTSLLLLSGYPIISQADQASEPEQNSDQSFIQAMKDGAAGLAFRLRHENAQQANLKTAQATTLRTKVNYDSAEFNNMQLALELIDVSNFFGQKYNPRVDGLNKPEYATVRDPKGTGITVGNFTYTGFDATKIILGRQYISLDNERFIGKVDFRQYPQNFDAISVNNKTFDNFDLYYAYATNVNTTDANGRTNNGRRKLHTHLLNVGWSGFQYGKITGYTYFNKDKTVKNNSHVLLGVKIAGDEAFKETFGWSYSAEFARQLAKFNNPNRYNANYFAFDLSKSLEIFEGSIGYERLAGNNNNGQAFQTPMGSNPNFLGWAEAFTTTPQRGIQDIYAKLSAETGQVKFILAYHDFRHVSGGNSRKAGNEIDMSAGTYLNDAVSCSIAYAHFNPKHNSAPKTRRVWLTLNAKFL